MFQQFSGLPYNLRTERLDKKICSWLDCLYCVLVAAVLCAIVFWSQAVLLLEFPQQCEPPPELLQQVSITRQSLAFPDRGGHKTLYQFMVGVLTRGYNQHYCERLF